MNNLAMALVRLTRHNRDGSFATQANRRRGLVAMANDLYALGYQVQSATALKPKHVEALISHWQSNHLSTGTIKNRLGWIRWWATKVNKASILPRDNYALGLPKRQPNPTNRAKPLTTTLPDPRMNLALQLMHQFGLRLEEALKFRVSTADRTTHVQLQPSWTKGGRPRSIPIRTQAQRTLLNTIKTLTNTNSLILSDQTYIQFRKTFEQALRSHGITNVHGLRHAYAQQRYLEITGRACPKAGGTPPATQTEYQTDRAARSIISAELGHTRLNITKTYLG